ncbi:MAG: hypothetical protein ACJ07L_11365 [Opitutales bacterium]
MAKTALLVTRDSTGLKDFSKCLVEEFGVELRVVTSVVGDEISGADSIEIPVAVGLVESGEVDLLVANFYDVSAVGREFMSWKSALNAFDHGIVDLIRLAARRPQKTAVVGSPEMYGDVLNLLRKGDGSLSGRFRMDQACNALRAVSEFDASVAQYLEMQGGEAPDIDALSGYPKSIRFSWKRAHALPEGDTPRQKAALYGNFGEHFEKISGPELDYGSVIDLSLAVYAIGEFEKTTAVIIQSGALISAASGESVEEAVDTARRAIEPILSKATLVVNGTVDSDLLGSLGGQGHFSSVLAPAYVSKVEFDGTRLLVSREGLGYEALQEVRSVAGGALVQDINRVAVNPFAWRMPSANQPLVTQWEDMLFGVRLSRHLRSTGCVAIAGERVMAQASSLLDQRLAWDRLLQGGVSIEGSSVVFDVDIKDPEEIDRAKAAGVSVLVHPGIDLQREVQLVDRANKVGMALVATGVSFRKI